MTTSTHAQPTSLYRFFDDDDRLLYVGITSRGMSRWTQHAKSKAWWPEVATATTEHYPDRDAALRAEREAIIAEHPLYNVVHNSKAGADGVYLACGACGSEIQGSSGYLEIDLQLVFKSQRDIEKLTRENTNEFGILELEMDQLMYDWPGMVQWKAWHQGCDPDPESHAYHISSDRICTYGDVLLWTEHLSGKDWLNATDWPYILGHLGRGSAEGPLRIRGGG